MSGFLLSQPAPDPPSDLTLSRISMYELLVSWTAPSQVAAVTGYVIYYHQDGGERMSVNASADATDVSITITGLTLEVTYSISMVATSDTLSSIVSGPQNITIGIPIHVHN